MADKFSVWARSRDPEWTARNRCSDVLVLFNVDKGKAEGLVNRLQLLYGDKTLEIHPAGTPPVPNSVGSGV